MADALGILSKMALKTLGSGWNAYPTWSAITPGGALVPFLSESFSSNYSRIQNDTLSGMGGRLPSEQGVEAIPGTTEHYLNYNTMDMFLAYIMGLDTPGSPNVITIVDNITDKYFGMEFEKQTARHRVWPCKAMKMTISGEKDQYCKLSVDWIARNFESTQTAFVASMTQPVNYIVPFDDLVFKIADQLNAIAVGDTVGIESFEIVLDRQYKGDDYTSDNATAAGAGPKQCLEPISNSFRGCTLKIKVPRYAVNTFETWKDANTPLMADLLFTYANPTYTKRIEFPELRIIDGFNSNIGGPGILTVEGTLEAYRSSAGNPMHVGNEMRVLYTP